MGTAGCCCCSAIRGAAHARPSLICWQTQQSRIQDGIIFRGERVVVPTSLRTEMKRAVHQAHLGTESCLRRARECLYWPGMNADMRDYISRCERCRNFEISNQKETLLPHELPSRPWEKVGTDLFSLDGRDYLIT